MDEDIMKNIKSSEKEEQETLYEDMQDILQHIKRAKSDPEDFRENNIAHVCCEEAGLCELLPDILRAGIARFIKEFEIGYEKNKEFIKAGWAKEKTNEFASNLIIQSGLELIRAESNNKIELPEDIKDFISELKQAIVNVYLETKSYAHAERFYRVDLAMPEKAAEINKLVELYPYDHPDREVFPDLHLGPSVYEIFENLQEKIKGSPLNITREETIKIIEELGKKIEAEINKIKGNN